MFLSNIPKQRFIFSSKFFVGLRPVIEAPASCQLLFQILSSFLALYVASLSEDRLAALTTYGWVNHFGCAVSERHLYERTERSQGFEVTHSPEADIVAFHIPPTVTMSCWLFPSKAAESLLLCILSATMEFHSVWHNSSMHSVWISYNLDAFCSVCWW